MPFKERRSGKLTGRWVAKVVVKGEQRWLGTFERKADARKAEDAERSKLAKGLWSLETCDSFALRWVTDYPRPKDTSNRYNEERVRRFAIDFMDLPLRDMDRPTARRWAMANPGRLNSVSAMFTDAMNDGLIDHNPFRELRIPRSAGRRNIEVLTEPELYRLADRALEVHGADYGLEFRALLLFAAHVGVRPGELMMLKGSSVHGRLLHVDWQRNKYGSVTRPKNGNPRVVTLLEPARSALADLGHRGPDEFLFRSKQGKPLGAGTLFYAWNPVRVADGRSGLDFYEITRHYCATWMLERGASHADVAVQLGHEDGGALVMSTYGHPSKDAARQRLLALDAADDELTEMRRRRSV